MEFKINTKHYENIDSIEIKNKIKEVYNTCLDESLKGNKVAFYYEDLNNNIISYNEDICFYAASTIKILTCLLIFKQADEGIIDLNQKLLVTSDDIITGGGIIKHQKQDTEYTIDKLIELCIIESDNTAYIKLIRFIGKDKVIEYGKSLGALHTLEGKDSYGITNCSDMIIYWKELIKYIKENRNGAKFKKYLLNPTTKFIKNDKYLRKYGKSDIAYHETGYVDIEKPYYMILLTQLNKEDYKEDFINQIAKILDEINNIV